MSPRETLETMSGWAELESDHSSGDFGFWRHEQNKRKVSSSLADHVVKLCLHLPRNRARRKCHLTAAAFVNKPPYPHTCTF